MSTGGAQVTVEATGSMEFRAGGARMLISTATEETYIEVAPVHDRRALAIMEDIADSMGYELVPEWDHLAEDLPGGYTRHWLELKETE